MNYVGVCTHLYVYEYYVENALPLCTMSEHKRNDLYEIQTGPHLFEIDWPFPTKSYKQLRDVSEMSSETCYILWL